MEPTRTMYPGEGSNDESAQFQRNNGESVILAGRCCDNDTATHGYVFILADWNPRMKNDDEGDRRCCDHWNRVNGHSPDEALSRFYCQSGSCLRLVPSWEERRNKRERLSKKFEKPGGDCVSFIFFILLFRPFEFSFFFFSLFLFFFELEPDGSRLRTFGELVRDSNRK